jgi:hypothetical protein
MVFTPKAIVRKASFFRQALESSDVPAFPRFPQVSPQDIVVKNLSQTTP